MRAVCCRDEINEASFLRGNDASLRFPFSDASFRQSLDEGSAHVVVQRMSKRVLSLGLLIGFFFTACVPGSQAADYGAKVSYKKGGEIVYPDFLLTYLGERHVATPAYPRGFHYYDFQVVAGASKQTVSWSAGTGDIGPALFHVSGKQFALELSRSDKLGPLKPNEVVVSRAPSRL